MEETIGEVCGIQGETTVEWKIKDFSSLSNETNKYYFSPKFYFSSAPWTIKMYPNGETVKKSVSFVSLFVYLMSSGSMLNVNYSLALKNCDGKKEDECTDTKVFGKNFPAWGWTNFISRSLLEKNKTLLPSDVLTVCCTLKISEQDFIAGSFLNRLQDVSDNLKNIYLKQKETDIVIKVDDGDIGAHRLILKTRSPFFEAMLNDGTDRNKTEEINVKDINRETMDRLLLYIYSGDIGIFKRADVLSTYDGAEKLAMEDVKEMCSKFITENLSVEWVCDVIKFADLHKEKELSLRSREYFNKNAKEILETDRWKTFARENQDISVELLGTVVTSLLRK